MHRLDLDLYSHPKELFFLLLLFFFGVEEGGGGWGGGGGGGGDGVRTHVNSKGKIPSTGKILLRRGLNPPRV